MSRAPGRRSLLDHPARYVVVGFMAVISAGTALLLLPFSVQDGRTTSVLDALFTATSAVCVTGLAVVDTGTHWSGFGQGVLLGLIEIGGLGYMTVTSLVVMLMSKRLGLRRQLMANAERGALSLGDVRHVLAGLGVITVAVQLVAAVLLTLRIWWSTDVGFGTSVWSGVFHAVSAFNNAGFSLYSDSLVAFQRDWMVLVPVMGAVFIGGLGFPVLVDLRRVGWRWRPLSLHSKVTLSGTAGLLAIGFVVLTSFEWTNPATLGPLATSEKLLNGAFASVTPRTAGFNSIEVAEMRPQSLLTTIMLMFVGAGSAGTSGGIKVSTFMILAFVIWSQLRGDADITSFDRRISEDTERRGITVALLAVGLVMAGTITMLMSDFRLIDSLFETVSAFGTVGLSTGVTADLPAVNKLIVIGIMLIGRVGPITLGAALVLRLQPSRFRLPEEGLLIG